MLKKKGSRKVYYCSLCQSEIPRIYFESPDLSYTKIGLLGYSGHGKSTFVTALMSTLNQLTNSWKNLTIETLDDDSHHSLNYKTTELIKGNMPLPSPAVYPRPTFFKLSGFPDSDLRFISIFDTGGKLFENLELMTKKGRFYSHTDVIYFVISLVEEEMKDIWNMKIMKLLDRYINVVYSRYGTKTAKKQDIIFILTKADQLLKLENGKKMDQEISSKLMKSPIDNYIQSPSDIKNQINENSERIEYWLRSNNCNSFINFAKDHFRNVSFSLVSIYGSTDSEENKIKLLTPDKHWAVLDPFIWTLASIN
jgi:GTP-binding protein EngB required for normal cell division